jgi:tetratricopeptide (TPR) repeat protein
LGEWQKRVFTAAGVLGLLMTAALAVAQPSNLGDNQIAKTNNALERAAAEVGSASTEVQKHPESTEAQYVLAMALDRLGDLQTLRARHPFPYQAGYRAALELARNNCKAYRRSDLMEKVARLETTAAPDSEHTLWEFRDAARQYYGRARVIYQRLVALEPHNNKWKLALARNYTKTNPGEVGIEKVRVYYQPALDILLRLAKSEPANDDFQRDLAATYETIGGQITSMTRSLPAEYHEALAIRMKLFRSNESSPLFIRELAITYGMIRETLAIRGKWEASRDAMTDELGLYQDLAALDPANMEWQQALSTAHMDFAAIKNDNNGPGEKLEAEVLAHYEKALGILTRLIQLDPMNTEVQRVLVESYETKARFYINRGMRQESIASYLGAQQQLAQFAQRYPNDRGWLFYQLDLYFSIGHEYSEIQRWAAPHAQAGIYPEPEKFKAASVAQEDVFKNMAKIIDTLFRMTEAPIK